MGTPENSFRVCENYFPDCHLVPDQHVSNVLILELENLMPSNPHHHLHHYRHYRHHYHHHHHPWDLNDHHRQPHPHPIVSYNDTLATRGHTDELEPELWALGGLIMLSDIHTRRTWSIPRTHSLEHVLLLKPPRTVVFPFL